MYLIKRKLLDFDEEAIVTSTWYTKEYAVRVYYEDADRYNAIHPDIEVWIEDSETGKNVTDELLKEALEHEDD